MQIALLIFYSFACTYKFKKNKLVQVSHVYLVKEGEGDIVLADELQNVIICSRLLVWVCC